MSGQKFGVHSLDDRLGDHVGRLPGDDDPPLYRVVLTVCRACLVGEGAVCWSPGCLFVWRDVWGPVAEAMSAPGAEDVHDEVCAEMTRRYAPDRCPGCGIAIIKGTGYCGRDACISIGGLR